MPSLTVLAGSPWELFLLDVSIKAALIYAAAWSVSLILSRRRSSAAARHLVWCLAIGGVLGLPVLSAMLPSWNVAVSWQKVESLSLPATADEASAARTTPGHGLIALTQAEEASSMPAIESEFAKQTPLGSLQQVNDSLEPTAISELPVANAWSWAFWLWLAGACLALLAICLGVVSLWSLTSRSRVVASGPLYTALQQMAGRIGLTCSVRMLQSDARSMPMTWGIRRPTILLPEGAELWSGERLRVVLLHELAHIQRRDCMSQLMAQLARAVYWFNPLAWLAERRLRNEQEQACDDLVLRNGFCPADYAEHLLQVSAGFRSPVCSSAIGLAMARKSKIEQRLLAILNPRQNRRSLSRRQIGFLAVTSLLLLSPLSVLHLDSASGEEPPVQAIARTAQVSTSSSQPTDRATALADLRAKIAEQYVTPVDENAILQGAIKGMLDALHDPYSDYLTPEMLANLEKQIGGTLVGIGAQLEMHEQRIRVVTALPDSPALKAGIQPGDVILQIDGRPAADLREAVKWIVGPQGTVVRLTIGRAAGLDLEVDITRSPIRLQTVKGFRRGSDNRWNFLLDGKGKLGYVQIAQLATATPQELRDAIEPLKQHGLRGLIVDLRFCPGGMLDSAVAVSELFLSGGTIVSLHSRGGAPTTIQADPASGLGDFPVVALVNGQTASAAEVVAGALQDNHRAVVLGTRTIGKGSVQSLIRLGDGSGAIKLTTSHYRLPSGRNIDKREQEKAWGIDPDDGYFVPIDRAQVKTLLERRLAREIIGGKSDSPDKQDGDVTPKWIEEQQADPQLAAALKTLTARVETGEFVKVGNVSPAQVEQFLKREDALERRESVLQNLEQLNRELAELEKSS